MQNSFFKVCNKQFENQQLFITKRNETSKKEKEI